MVGDSSGRVTMASLDKIEQVPFESNVLVRHSPSSTAQVAGITTLAIDGDVVLSCFESGGIGWSS